MTDIHRMRLSGHSDIFVVTALAHRQLVDYLSEARERLTGTPDADETMRDLEAALGDRLVALAEESDAIDDRQMADTIDSLGNVEMDSALGERPAGSVRRRFWARIEEGKWFGGVCVGLAARGNLRLDWVRTFAVFAMLMSGGLVGVLYLVLWAVLPPVATIAEYERRTRTD